MELFIKEKFSDGVISHNEYYAIMKHQKDLSFNDSKLLAITESND
jgi:hypothetical protein